MLSGLIVVVYAPQKLPNDQPAQPAAPVPLPGDGDSPSGVVASKNDMLRRCCMAAGITTGGAPIVGSPGPGGCRWSSLVELGTNHEMVGRSSNKEMTRMDVAGSCRGCFHLWFIMANDG